jgi:D-alanyl-D-alanine carboxypeptidase
MKTGFICASGYNLVASATRNGRHLIAIVLGASSGKQRSEIAARLLEKGFNGAALSWLMPSLGTVDNLPPIAAAPPDLRDEICGKGRRNRTDHAEEEQAENAQPAAGFSAFASSLTSFQPATDQAPLLGPLVDTAPPVQVTVIGPGGSTANPEALMSTGRRKKHKAVRGKKGSKSTVIEVSRSKGKDAAASKKKSAAAKGEGGKAKAKAKPKAKPAKTSAKGKSASTAAAKR